MKKAWVKQGQNASAPRISREKTARDEHALVCAHTRVDDNSDASVARLTAGAAGRGRGGQLWNLGQAADKPNHTCSLPSRRADIRGKWKGGSETLEVTPFPILSPRRKPFRRAPALASTAQAPQHERPKAHRAALLPSLPLPAGEPPSCQ